MVKDAEFIKQEDGSYLLVVTMDENDYLELNKILDALNTTLQEVINAFLKETIRLGNLPFDYSEE